jgi:hypothetical protein
MARSSVVVAVVVIFWMVYVMGAGELTKTTAIKKHYRGLGRAVGRSQIQADLIL